MLQFTLLPETTPESFCSWLRIYTLRISGRRFPAEDWPKCSVEGYAGEVKVGDQCVGAVITGTYSLLREAGAAEVTGDLFVSDLPFEFIQLNSVRIEVSAQCRIDALSPYFEELRRAILERWPEARAVLATDSGSDQADTATVSVPDWLPKKKETLLEWKKAYDIMIEVDREYSEGYLSWDKDESVAGIDEYREALRAGKLKYCDKRIRQIKRAGDRGWIDQSLASLG